MKREKPNSAFALGGVSHFAESFAVVESSTLRINIRGNNPTRRRSTKRITYCIDKHPKTMRGIMIFVFTLLLSTISSAQDIVLKKEAKLDTLYLTLTQTDTSDLVLNKQLVEQLDSLINNFNKEDKRFKIKIDSSHRTNSIMLTMGQINYVTRRRNLWLTGLNLAMIGANILILPYFPPVIPFYLMPLTHCKVTIEGTSDILTRKSKVFINPNGYFRKQEKQKMKFKKKFNKVFVELFNEINRQYKRNNKNNKS